MTISKATAVGQRIYSTDPIPENLKAKIRAKFGTLLDDKRHALWDTYSLTDPNYIGVICIGALPVEISGELQSGYKIHLDFTTGDVHYEVYANGVSAFELPIDVAQTMANSPVYIGSIKTDREFNPIEWTTYYRLPDCAEGEYEALREQVPEKHESGFGIGIKTDGINITYEEYGHA